ncbi:MAG: PspC domain-containing protein [Mucinivorans sp.]
MKNTVSASISGIPFIFDQDAFDVLDTYLDRLEHSYAQNPDAREIITDIEARIVELILSEQPNEKIVTVELTQRIVDQLGLPEDVNQGQENATEGENVEQFPRRLYRNKDGAKFGGVCSGMATYLNSDPVWLRLFIFIPLILLIITSPFVGGRISGFLALSFASAIVLYIVLWIIIPMARTPRQKLEMRGEKITASSIHQNFTSAANDSDEQPSRASSVFSEVICAFGRVILFMIKVFAIIFGLAVAVSAIALVVAYFVLAFGSDWIAVETMSAFSSLQGVSPAFYFASVTLAILLPLLLIVWLVVRAVFAVRGSRIVSFTLFGLWLVATIFATVVTIKNAYQIEQGCKALDYKIELYHYNDCRHLDE